MKNGGGIISFMIEMKRVGFPLEMAKTRRRLSCPKGGGPKGKQVPEHIRRRGARRPTPKNGKRMPKRGH